jgi:hypothetical protein
MGEGRGEVHTEFCLGDFREGDHLKDPGVDGRVILKRFFQKVGWGHELD